MEQTSNYIEAKDVLDATNNGLDIILYLYPQAEASVHEKKRKFKLREDEKTASVNLYQLKPEDGSTWLVTDFGGDQQPRNGILSWMLERGVDFVTALREIAGKFNIAGRSDEQEQVRAAYSEEPANPDTPENTWDWEARKEWTDFEIESILSKNTLKSLKWKDKQQNLADEAYSKIVGKFEYYRWRSLVNYSLVKSGKKMTFSATDEYPIYLINEGTHQKLYQPKHPDKGKRFLYIGKKPKYFIHGLEQLEKLYNKNKEDQEVDDAWESEDSDKKKKAYKLDDAIICSGGSDAINVALLGYQVLWLNSETEPLQEWQYKELANKVEKIYQMQDIDPTGKASAHKMAMAYLDIYTIELPEELKEKRDARRNPCKDLRDYLNHWDRWDFKQLMDTALPYRFWERTPNYVGRGDKQVFVGYKYTYRVIQGNNFLTKNGFGRLVIDEKKNEWIFVQRVGNVVREVDAGIIQDYLHDFLERGFHDIELREALHNSSRLNSSSLEGIKKVDIDFTDFTPTSQFIFFKNRTVEVTPEGMKFHKPGTVSKYIWDDEVHKHHIEPVKEPPFIITKDPDLGTYSIDIKDKDCPFFKYLIQTSRIHWRTELEQGDKFKNMTPVEQEQYAKDNHCVINGPNLTDEEIEEQEQHLINKLFIIGWHLHRYKAPDKGWFSFAMDGKMSEDGKSHGGSGKSITFERALSIMLPKNMVINGRNAKLVEGEFKYDGVNKHTRYVLIDDAFEYLKLDQFYVDVSGPMEINPKGLKKFTIPYEMAPKIAFTSNYIPRDIGPSTERRIMYYVVSDYYHNKGETDDYIQHRTPKTDLGMSLFTDFTREQWNSFYNLMLHALQFFLTTDEKIKPAMENVNNRQLLAIMGENFREWADAYFAPETGRLDKYFIREEAATMFNKANKSDITAQFFKKKLAAWCRFNHFIFNPKQYQGKNKNIMVKVEVRTFKTSSNSWEPVPNVPKETKEVFFIQTRDELPKDPNIGHPEEEDKLPF